MPATVAHAQARDVLAALPVSPVLYHFHVDVHGALLCFFLMLKLLMRILDVSKQVLP